MSAGRNNEERSNEVPALSGEVRFDSNAHIQYPSAARRSESAGIAR
jgi:hypothetical protein